MGIVTQSIETWFSFVKGNARELFIGILKSNLYMAATIIIGILFFAVVFAGVWIGGGESGDVITISIIMNLSILPYNDLRIMQSFLILFIAATISGIFLMLSQAFMAPIYRTIHATYERKEKIDILESAKEKAYAIIGYQIVISLIYIVVMLPLMIGSFLGRAALGIMGFIFEIIIILVGFVLGIFMQFALYELIISNKGPIESIKASISLVNRNLRDAVVFTFIKAAINGVIGVVFTIVLYGIIIAVVMAGIGIYEIGGLTTITIAIIAVFGIIFFAGYLLVQATIIETIELPMTYVFWKAISTKKTINKKN